GGRRAGAESDLGGDDLGAVGLSGVLEPVGADQARQVTVGLVADGGQEGGVVHRLTYLAAGGQAAFALVLRCHSLPPQTTNSWSRLSPAEARAGTGSRGGGFAHAAHRPRGAQTLP